MDELKIIQDIINQADEESKKILTELLKNYIN